MLSPQRQAANAANAQLSTSTFDTPDPTPNTRRGGPRTPEGKARSSQNALKHCLTARDLVVRADEHPEFEELRDSLYDELQPHGPLEHDVFSQLLHAAWNLRRVRRLEAEASRGEGADRLSQDRFDDTFHRFARYHACFERSYYRALRELRELQTNRALRTLLAPQPPETLPVLASLPEITKRTRHLPPPPLRQPLPSPAPLVMAPPDAPGYRGYRPNGPA